MSPAPREPTVFFQPSAETPVADVLGALEGLEARSRGEVKEASELYPGIFERTEHGISRNAAMDRGPAYYEQEAHLSPPGGFLHPALAPAVASILGWTVDDALAVARCLAHVEDGRAVRPEPEGRKAFNFVEHGERTGPQALAALLRGKDVGPWREQLGTRGPEALIVDRIPVVPLSRRFPVLTGGRHVVPGPINTLYRKLLHVASQYPRLVEQRRPAIMLSAEVARGQDLGEALCQALSGVPAPARAPGPQSPERVEAWRPAGPPTGFAELHPDPPPGEQPVGIAFDEAGGLLVQFAHALVHVTAEGQVASAHAVPYGLHLLSVSGSRVLFFGADRFHVLDLERREWARDYVPGFCYGAVFSDGWLRNTETDASTRMGGELVDGEWSSDMTEFAKPCAATPDNRYVWMYESASHGALFRIATAQREWDAARENRSGEWAPVLLGTGALLTLEESDEDTLYDAAASHYEQEGGYFEPATSMPGFACALTPEGGARLLDEGVVSEDGQPLLRLAMRVGAAGFSRDGARLAIASQAQVCTITLGERPEMLSRFSLEELGPALPQEDVPSLSEDTLPRSLPRLPVEG